MQFRDYDNFYQMLSDTVNRRTHDPAYRWFDKDGNATSVSWQQFYDQVRAVGKSLIALGLKKGDKANILGYTCYKWVLTDVA